MSVRPETLENPERGLNLVTREGQEEGRPTKRKNGEADELSAMKDRIEAARTIQPPDNVRHCLDCWEKARNATILAIEGAKAT